MIAFVGILNIFTTGRPAAYVEPVCQALGKMIDFPDICENGAVLRSSASNRWWRHPLVSGINLARFEEAKQRLLEIGKNIGATQEAGKDVTVSLNPPRSTPHSMDIAAFYAFMREEAAKLGIGDEVIFMTHSASAVDITPAGVNKLTALEHVTEQCSIDLTEIAAIGDTKGDRLVLAAVGLPMCPQNATTEVKDLVRERSGYVSPYPVTAGVVDCLLQVTDNPMIHRLGERALNLWAESMINQPVEKLELLTSPIDFPLP